MTVGPQIRKDTTQDTGEIISTLALKQWFNSARYFLKIAWLKLYVNFIPRYTEQDEALNC